MLAGELRSRARKLEQEQKQRLVKDRARAQKEHLLEERARQQRQEHEEEASRRRAAVIAAAEIERLQHEEDLEYNNGVWWSAQLSVVPISDQAAAQRGIRRAADKISLPPSASNLLLSQDASKNGAMFFELSTSDKARTHAGLLDFTAVEGTVGIPDGVAHSLWDGGAAPDDARVTVTYRRLEKGTYTRLQPASADFQREAGDAVEAVLVAALSKRSAISEGDWLAAEIGDRRFTLRVQKLLPLRQVSVIDTEMEAEVEPSIETEQRLEREASDAEKARVEAARLASEQEARRLQQAAVALEEAARRERVRQEKAASLPPEASAEEPSTLCLVRFPDGSRHTRRFRQEESLSVLFDFVDSRGGSGLPPGSYRLATQYPRRTFGPDQSGSLLQVGLGNPQEALMLEPIAQT